MVEARQILRRLKANPCEPFRIRLADDSVVEIRGIGTVSVGANEAVLPVEYAEEDNLVVRTRTVCYADLREMFE
jgi:hypothetical protein